MNQSSGRFLPNNVFSEMVWNAVLEHVSKQNTTNLIGIFNCKIFYSTYISLISSYTNISNTENVEFYLMDGLESFFDWARISKNTFKTDCENFIFDYSNEIINSYVKHFSRVFYNEIANLGEDNYPYNTKTPYYMLLFNVSRPTDDLLVYDDNYFYDSDIEVFKIEEFFQIVNSNFKIINHQFDSLLNRTSNLKLSVWEKGKGKKMIFDKLFFDNLVIKPFDEPRCQICGNFYLREDLTLNKE